MDLTLMGVGFIVGNLVYRGFRREEDPYKVTDIAMICLGLAFIVGSRYHFFGA